MKRLLLIGAVFSLVAAAPNAAEMRTISYLPGVWNCAWTAGTAAGTNVSTFTPVMDGAWLEETEAVRSRSGAPVVMTMHFTGYDPQTKKWMHVGPNADGTFEVASSSDTHEWDDMIRTGKPGYLNKISNTQFTLAEKFTQDGQELTYNETCKKAPR